MSFDRAVIERVVDEIRRHITVYGPFVSWRVALEILPNEIVNHFDACFAEIDRLAKLAEMRGANYDLAVSERNEALAQGRRWREKLAEMLDQYEYSCQHKGKYLVKKHGDAELIAEARALLAETEER